MQVERLGRYEVVRHLAHGGMATVYLARLTGIGGFERHVVLKTLHEDLVADDTLVPMFLDEARLVANLHHQHIAQVFDIGHDGRTYYLAMEYVHGETVRGVLESASKQGFQLPLDFGVSVVCAAAAALHHAHERCDRSGHALEIVHRDVTPSNVIVSYDGSIKLIDFGIAKANLRMTSTRTGFIKGKAGYMAPEQVRGYDIDRRSDVFALGVLLYELTTQRRAFHSESQLEQLELIATATIAPPSHVVPRYPVDLEDVVLRALGVDPDDRFQDAAEMRRELERVATLLGLVLGEGSVIAVLDQLYGQRPEPWLVASGSIDYDETPPIVDLPFSLDVDQRRRPTTHGIVAPTAQLETEPVDLEELIVEELSPPPALPPTLEPSRPDPPPLVVVPVERFATGVSGPRRKRTWMVLALTVCGALGVCAALGLSYLLIEDEPAAPPQKVVAPQKKPAPPKPVPPPTRTAPAAKPPPAPPPPPPPSVSPGHVILDVVTDPPEATVVLDGVRLGRTPYHAEVPVKKGAWLKVRRFDRLPVKIRVALEKDVQWTVKLPPRPR